jgi:hypothetical protein
LRRLFFLHRFSFWFSGFVTAQFLAEIHSPARALVFLLRVLWPTCQNRFPRSASSGSGFWSASGASPIFALISAAVEGHRRFCRQLIFLCSFPAPRFLLTLICALVQSTLGLDFSCAPILCVQASDLVPFSAREQGMPHRGHMSLTRFSVAPVFLLLNPVSAAEARLILVFDFGDHAQLVSVHHCTFVFCSSWSIPREADHALLVQVFLCALVLFLGHWFQCLSFSWFSLCIHGGFSIVLIRCSMKYLR